MVVVVVFGLMAVKAICDPELRTAVNAVQLYPIDWQDTTMAN